MRNKVWGGSSVAEKTENITDSKSRSPDHTHYYKGVTGHDFMLHLNRI